MNWDFLDDWFSPMGRRNRKSFVLASLALYLSLGLLLLIWLFFAETHRARMIGLLLLGAPAILSGYFMTAQRLRDMNLSGWIALLWIPIGMFDNPAKGAFSWAAIIILCFVPGTSGPNKFGHDPLS